MNPRRDTTVATRCAVDNVNAVLSASRQVTNATMASYASTTVVDWDNATATTVSKSSYPIFVDLDQPAAAPGALVIDADVAYARRREIETRGLAFAWTDAMAARAHLSENATSEGGTGATNETFVVSAETGAPCYARRVSAVDGAVTADVLATAFACQLPGGLRFCGSDVCGSSFAPDAAHQKTPAAKPPPRGPRRLHYERAAPPVRLATPPRASGGPPGPRD